MAEHRKKNGEFYALGEKVFRAPIETKTETGTSINCGFPVCTVSDYVSTESLVECLNASRHHDALAKALQEARSALAALDHPNGRDSGLDMIRGGKPVSEIIDNAIALIKETV